MLQRMIKPITNRSKDRNVWATLIGGLEVRLAGVRGTVTRFGRLANSNDPGKSNLPKLSKTM